MAKKFYAVKQGRVPGVYQTWEECRAQVDAYSGAVYKSFPTAEKARAFVDGIEQRQNAEPFDLQEPVQRDMPGQTSKGLVAYVDGSYHNGTGEFSYGVVILQDGEEICFGEKLSDPALAAMRNVAGEIKGAEAAMRYAMEHGYQELCIYHDYEGIARWCTGEWRANKSGTQAYKAYYDSICTHLQVHFQKVKGHSGDKYNDMADRLAREALGIA